VTWDTVSSGSQGDVLRSSPGNARYGEFEGGGKVNVDGIVVGKLVACDSSQLIR